MITFGRFRNTTFIAAIDPSERDQQFIAIANRVNFIKLLLFIPESPPYCLFVFEVSATGVAKSIMKHLEETLLACGRRCPSASVQEHPIS